MTDKEHILNILRIFRSLPYHRGISSQYQEYKSLKEDVRHRILDKLIEGELVNIGHVPEKIKITAKGIVAKAEDFDNEGNYKPKNLEDTLKAEISELQKEALILQIDAQKTSGKKANKRLIIGFALGLISSLLTTIVRDVWKESPKLQEYNIEQRIESSQKGIDTTYIKIRKIQSNHN